MDRFVGSGGLVVEAARSLSMVMGALFVLQYEPTFCHEREEYSSDFRTFSTPPPFVSYIINHVFWNSAIFAAFGPVKTVEMSKNPATGGHKGYCFLEYAEKSSAEFALSAMNGFKLAGRAIKVCRERLYTAREMCLVLYRVIGILWVCSFCLLAAPSVFSGLTGYTRGDFFGSLPA